MEDARAKGNAIIREHQEALEKIFEEHKEESLRQAELTMKSETAKARKALNKEMAKAQIDLKREQGQCQTYLKNRLFKRVRVLIDDFMKTDEYRQLLVSYIRKSMDFANGEPLIIYLNPTDEPFKEELETTTGAKLTVSREDFIGGTRAVMNERRILIDNSFKSALSEEYDKFLFLGGEEHA